MSRNTSSSRSHMHNTKGPNKEYMQRRNNRTRKQWVSWEQQGLPSFHRQQPIDSRKIGSSIPGLVPVAPLAGRSSFRGMSDLRQGRCKLLKMGWGRKETERVKNGVWNNGEAVEIDQAGRKEERRGERPDWSCREAQATLAGWRGHAVDTRFDCDVTPTCR